VTVGRLIFFDLDGTLVDSSPGIWSSVRQAARQLALPELTPGQLRAMVGPPLQDGFRTVLGVPEGDVARAVAAYRANYAAGAMLDIAVYPGVPELLAELVPAGATLAVATSKPEVYARRILERVELRAMFAGVHGATLDGVIRYKKQIVGRALAAHPRGLAPVLVGDRAQDVLGATAHGLPCIGASWGMAEPGELRAAGATSIAAAPGDVPAALTQL
jgi:phosphoglycolate phosphatase